MQTILYHSQPVLILADTDVHVEITRHRQAGQQMFLTCTKKIMKISPNFSYKMEQPAASARLNKTEPLH